MTLTLTSALSVRACGGGGGGDRGDHARHRWWSDRQSDQQGAVWEVIILAKLWRLSWTSEHSKNLKCGGNILKMRRLLAAAGKQKTYRCDTCNKTFTSQVRFLISPESSWKLCFVFHVSLFYLPSFQAVFEQHFSLRWEQGGCIRWDLQFSWETNP